MVYYYSTNSSSEPNLTKLAKPLPVWEGSQSGAGNEDMSI